MTRHETDQMRMDYHKLAALDSMFRVAERQGRFRPTSAEMEIMANLQTYMAQFRARLLAAGQSLEK